MCFNENDAFALFIQTINMRVCVAETYCVSPLSSSLFEGFDLITQRVEKPLSQR